ncbi:MAG: hypothetical protein OXF79_30575 [Chloroflexi bacterium]|nr:hypothetical protein [Chloroflexota bacterium]
MASATAAGPFRVRARLPDQDSAAQSVVAAMADGAGSASQSDEISRIGVTTSRTIGNRGPEPSVVVPAEQRHHQRRRGSTASSCRHPRIQCITIAGAR